MKNNKITKILVTIISMLLFATILFSMKTNARYIGVFNNLCLRGHETKRQEYAVKSNASRYVINLEWPRYRNYRVNLRSMILNSNGDWRANNWGLTYEGTRNVHNNFATPNYYYALEFTRELPTDENICDFYGSWSLDEW